MRRDRALGWLVVLAGLGLALGVQVRVPLGVPLYDGQPIVETYRYLHPANGQRGNPTSASSTKQVDGTTTPVFAIATEEQPPQAQMTVQEDAFQLPAGTTELQVSITPVDAAAQPTEGQIAGNVYRFSVTTPGGQALAPRTCDTCRTLVIRAPENVAEGTISHLDGGAWVGVATFHAGIAGMFQANAPAMGDYAVIVASGPASGGGGGGLDLLLFGGIALALFFAAVAGLFWYRRRPAPVPVARLGPGRGRVPSKRRGPRRPPSGRSGS
ncbi:MAG TPA: hypothetical protein VL749_06860 [Patescibacteria group bacterium]|nr:hypothetical protein [Patescibacteria group bacterium]